MDLDRLVDAVTKEIMKRLEADESGAHKIMAAGCDATGFVAEGVPVVNGRCGDAPGDCCCVLLSAGDYARLCGQEAPVSSPLPAACCGGKVVDLTGKRLVSEREMKDCNVQGGDVVAVAKNAILTALAVDYCKGRGAKIERR